MHHHLSPGNIAQVIETWGYLGIFVFVFVGNLGFPVPEESVVLAAGFLAGRDVSEPQGGDAGGVRQRGDWVTVYPRARPRSAPMSSLGSLDQSDCLAMRL